jgi:hypothetical protein
MEWARRMQALMARYSMRPSYRFAEHHGAGAAVAFATALLGPGAAEVLAQDFQQGAGGWYIDQRHDLAAADEPDGWVCHVFVPCARG